MKSEIIIRLAQLSDIESMMAVELSASQIFESLPIEIRNQLSKTIPPHDLAFYQKQVAAKTSWVLCYRDEVVGFICTSIICKQKILHIEELDVALPFQGKGLGKKLLDFVIQFALLHSIERLTLTTFKKVPWNAPFYLKCGFKQLNDKSLDERLTNILKDEDRLGLHHNTRCAMEMRL